MACSESSPLEIPLLAGETVGMCGRFTLTKELRVVAARFGVNCGYGYDEAAFASWAGTLAFAPGARIRRVSSGSA
jgi:hypothetical protein